MSTFDTPEPINVTMDVAVADVSITAGDRTDTVVEVQPTDPSRDLDVTAAAQTKVDFASGTLVIKGQKPNGYWRKVGSIDLRIELPAGSSVQLTAAVADIRGEGRLGEGRFKVASGQVRLDQTGKLQLSTSAGEVTVEHVMGDAEITTGSGDVRIRKIDGAGAIKNSNGASWVGEVTGDMRLNSANGGIVIDRARAAVAATTANGSIRIGEVVRGSIGLETAVGELEIGVREGTAALLDVRSNYGTVHSSLKPSDGPGQSDATVEVRARTAYGDILIHRS